MISESARILRGFAISFLLMALHGVTTAHDAAAQFIEPVRFELGSTPSRLAPGETAIVTVEAEIDDKWHLYSILNAPDAGPFPTVFSVHSASDGLRPAGYARESTADIAYDPNFETDLGWHADRATFRLPIRLMEDVGETSSGESSFQTAEIRVRFQACDDVSCLPPRTLSLPFEFERISGTASGSSGRDSSIPTPTVPASPGADRPVLSRGDAADPVFEAAGDGLYLFLVDPAEAEAAAAAAGAETGSAASGSRGGSLGSDGVVSFFWIALTAGFAALLTPCVFPMIPLTVSFFSKSESLPAGGEPSAGSRAGAIRKALLFGVSIVATFTILGALLALFIGVSGANQFASNPWVNLFIGGVLLAFGVSLLGFFELRLPYRLTNWLNMQSNRKGGVTGILFMALTISAVSFSCTAPFVGAVLAATAGGEWFYPILGMIGFSAAFASPFVLFALFPDWLQSLPKSGSWMNLVKVTLGFIELAAAYKFISNADLVWQWGLVSRPFTIASWMAIFLLASLHILGVFAIGHDRRPESVSPGRVVAAFPFLLFVMYLIPGLMGASLGIWDAWLPPKQATDVSVVMSVRSGLGPGSGATLDEEMWSEDYEASLARALETDVPVFVDFTGYTCTNCRAMETNVFPLADVQERFSQYELVRLYTDDGIMGPDHQRLQFELTGTVALPTYAVVNPDTGQLTELLVGYVEAEKFLAFLDRGLESHAARR